MDHRMYSKLPVKTSIGKLKFLQVLLKNFAGGGVEFPLPTDESKNEVVLDKWENSYSYYFNRALRHFVGKEKVKDKGNYYPGLHCDEAGWVDIMSSCITAGFLTMRRSRTEDDGLTHSSFREDRVNLMIKTAWAEFQKSNKVRIQFLCVVL